MDPNLLQQQQQSHMNATTTTPGNGSGRRRKPRKGRRKSMAELMADPTNNAALADLGISAPPPSNGK